MRAIGILQGKTAAQLFIDYLFVKGIESEVELDSADRWTVWVRAEEQVEEASEHFRRFTANPADPVYATEAQKAPAMRAAAASQEEAYRKRVRNRAETVSALQNMRSGKLTIGLIVVCAVIFIVMGLNSKLENQIFYWLSISNYRRGGGGIGLPEVMQGQVWRLLTPIFMHGGFLHLFFNLWWLKDLGGVLEWRMGRIPLAVLVTVIGVGSNLAQYYDVGPNFLGISGVVFGLLGFIWMKGRYDPNFGIQLPPVIVFMMLLWLVLGYSGMLERSLNVGIANTAHSAGLVIGMVCAFLPFWHSDRRP